MQKLVMIAIGLMYSLVIFAQEKGTITGHINDTDTKEGLIGVNIIEPGGLGSTTDLNGDFTLSLPVGTYEFTISYVGYESINLNVIVSDGSHQEVYKEMQPISIEFDEIVVSGSRYAKRVSQEVVSIEIIQPDLIENTLAIKLDDIAKRVSGVNVLDGQASIRAGSGWSFSIGSRVNVVLDGQSLLTPDRSSIKWRYLPLETVGQIEILKGASSVLYGSSAMNGTIHLQTLKPTKTPKNNFVSYVEVLDQYKNDDYNWWTGSRLTTGGYYSRAHKVSDRFEYVVGLNTNYTELPYYGDWGFNDYHVRTNLSTKWTSSRDARSTYGFRLNYTYYNENEYIFWEGSGTKALNAIDQSETKYHSLNVDPYYVRYDDKDNRHEIRGRLFYFDPQDSRNGGFANTEYLFQKSWSKGWNMVAGGLQDFLGWRDNELNGFEYALKWAVYAQLEKKWDKVSISGGMRTEIFKLSNSFGITYAYTKENAKTGKVQEIPLPLMQFGLNYQATPKTFLRFNIGQAFRIPSLYEAFLEYEFNGIDILAGKDLRPEYGWTSELGLKHNFASKKYYKGSFDAAFFWQEFKDMIEFQVSYVDGVALVSHNLPTARIAGYEVSLKQSVYKGQHCINLNVGYTYAFPIELSGIEGAEMRAVGTYLKNLFKYAGPVKNTPETFRTTGAMLKYRNRHLMNLIFEYENDIIVFGFYGRYYSLIENGDFELDSESFSFVPGITDYWEAKFPKGDFVADLNIGVKFLDKHSISLMVRNFTNREYMLRLAKIEPSRSWAWKYKVTF